MKNQKRVNEYMKMMAEEALILTIIKNVPVYRAISVLKKIREEFND